MDLLRYAAIAAFTASAGAAHAHVALTPASAPAGAYQVLRFGVGHGCDTAATTALRLEIPATVGVARPQPKPGWTLRVEHPADRPDAVTAVNWEGALPTDQFDEFVLLVRLPAAGPLAFPAVQTCGDRKVEWIESPTPSDPKPRRPAPRIEVTPTPPAATHDHHAQDAR